MNEIVNLGNGMFVKVTMLKGERGSNIQNIAKTSTSGLIDTYTITLTDGSTSSFQVTNGNGIVSIAKTSTAGLVDTYTITFENGDTTTFEVTNGENGQDVSSSNLAPVETTSTASQNYVVGEHLVFNGVYYVVTQPITQGDLLVVDTNIQREYVGDEIEGMDAKISQAISESQSNLATIEETATASKSYAINDFLVFNGHLYKVTQAIAQGGTLSDGVNITQTTVESGFYPKTGGIIDGSITIKCNDPSYEHVYNKSGYSVSNGRAGFSLTRGSYSSITTSNYSSEKYLSTDQVIGKDVTNYVPFYISGRNVYLIIISTRVATSDTLHHVGIWIVSGIQGSTPEVSQLIANSDIAYTTASNTIKFAKASTTYYAVLSSIRLQ